MGANVIETKMEPAFDVEDAARLLKAMGNPWRVQILRELLIGPKRVHDLEEILGLSQAYVSQQLARLRAEGIVEGDRNGRTVLYRLVDARVGPVLESMLRCRAAREIGRADRN